MADETSSTAPESPRVPTMDDVAVAAGVSVATVSRALRGSPKVRSETRRAVGDAAERLGFVVSRTASSLATGKVRRVAVLIGAPLTDWFSGSILDGIYDVLRAAGLDLLLYRVHDRTEREAFFAALPARRNADAVIVASFALADAEQATLTALDMPVVYLSQRVAGHPSVGIDDLAAGRTATRLLLGLGHRRFVYLRAAPDRDFRWSAHEREAGWAAELDAAGVAASERSLLELAAGSGLGDEAAARLLTGPLPVAVLAEDDDLALSVLASLERLGVDVPGDVSIVGFDGQRRAVDAGLTTVSQPVAELARLAAEAAVALATGPRTTAPSEVHELPTTVVLGRTTRAAPAGGRRGDASSSQDGRAARGPGGQPAATTT